ncbi:unnamed protein product [Adineta steineri]|uniref:Methyltransferase FkbM domain-containing protein n=1 Tax=Adineta steineri TaxID=433720 RepID=A0A815CIC3_9BILA|nr:unnamed protein product [Adineta steineri]CAF1285544.1 unnamed protein product [Adineta steineri]
MNVRSKCLCLLAIVIILYSILFYFKSNNDPLVSAISSRTMSIPNGYFTCDTRKNNSTIDGEKYKTCLKWSRNDAFWAVQDLRHKSFKNFLNASSLIIEVGGNTGLDTSKFIELYNCSIISFEPLIQMSNDLKKKFETNSKIEIQPYGLGNQARTISIEPFDNENTGTSMFRKVSNKNSTKIQTIEILNIIEVIQNIRKTKTLNNGMIDMISINCEGCEFEILPALISNNLLQYFRIIQFASHMNFLNDSSCIYCQIEQTLEKTHQIIYQYTMLWEAWVMKN